MRDLFGQVAGCFPRRETRQAASQMVDGLLMELEDYNCWSIAEAVGHRGPHRLQHLLSRAVWDDQQVLDAAAAWAVAQLDDGDAVLVVDETADEKSSTEAVGAARQYCGTVGGIALCQVHRHLDLRHIPGPHADRPGAVPAPGMRGRRRAPGAGRSARGGDVRDQTGAGRGAAAAGPPARDPRLLRDRR
jgi:hypothetical protein